MIQQSCSGFDVGSGIPGDHRGWLGLNQPSLPLRAQGISPVTGTAGLFWLYKVGDDVFGGDRGLGFSAGIPPEPPLSPPCSASPRLFSDYACCNFILSVFLFFFKAAWHMEVPRPEIKPELQLLAYARAITTPDLSLI